MLLLSVFGGLALVLAAIGIYGLMAFTVEQRTQEIGIRMALGAGAAALRGMIVRQGMVLASIGIALGLLAAYGLTRLLTAFLFGVKPVDPLVFAAVPASAGSSLASGNLGTGEPSHPDRSCAGVAAGIKQPSQP